MSCFISSAICCSLATASMSGIAMGYNYSLAEYIDLKETNVSVYLKRGVFDDDVTDDLDFRRSAGLKQPASSFRDPNFKNAEVEEETLSPRSGRRLDDSVYKSDDHNSFEGSLMKLTAKPPGFTTTTTGVTSDNKMDEIIRKYPRDSLDQLKAIHELINMRKSNEHRATIDYDKTTTPGHRVDNYFPGARRMMIEPDTPAKHNVYVGDRAIPFEHDTFKVNPVRAAVPDLSVAEAPNWFLPKTAQPETYVRTMHTLDDYENLPSTAFTYPRPIRYNTGVNRPTRVQPQAIPTPQPMAAPNEIPSLQNVDTRRLENSELNRVRDKLLMDKANFPSFRRSGYIQSDNEAPSKSEEADYEEDAKRGIQIRNKRYIKDKSSKGVIVEETSYTEHIPRAIFNKHVQIDHDKISLNQNVVGELHPESDEDMVTNNVNVDHIVSGGIVLNATIEKLNIDSIRKRNKSVFTINSEVVLNYTDIGVKENISLTTEESNTTVKANVYNTPLSLTPKTDTFMVRIVKLLSS